MKKVVLDTSLIIDHVRGKNKDLVKLLELKQKKKVELIVPVVVVFEFYSGQSLREKSIFQKTELLFAEFKIIGLNEEIAKLAAEINRKKKLYNRIGAIDLLIGSTAIYLTASLATKNVKDFKLIPGLKLFDAKMC